MVSLRVSFEVFGSKVLIRLWISASDRCGKSIDSSAKLKALLRRARSKPSSSGVHSSDELEFIEEESGSAPSSSAAMFFFPFACLNVYDISGICIGLDCEDEYERDNFDTLVVPAPAAPFPLAWGFVCGVCAFPSVSAADDDNGDCEGGDVDGDEVPSFAKTVGGVD